MVYFLPNILKRMETGQKKCLACLQTVHKSQDIISRRKISDGTSESDDCEALKSQLTMIFTLRKLMRVPQDACMQFLQDFGNPSSWASCCGPCSNLVAHARSAFDEIILLQRKFEKLQTEFTSIILLSMKSNGNLSESENGATHIARQFAINEIYNEANSADQVDIKLEQAKVTDPDLDVNLLDLVDTCPISAETCFVTEQSDLVDVKNNFPNDTSLFSSDFLSDDCNYDGMAEEHRLTDPLKIESENAAFECKFCGLRFLSHGVLKAHIATEHTGKSVACKICKKSFPNNFVLRSHTKTHFKSNKCEICGKVFRLQQLKNHKKTHLGIKPHECKVCGKSFLVRSNLLTHSRIHTGEKPYQCDFCGQGFMRTDHLRTHKMIHTGEKPYKCDICGERFTTSSNTKRHKKTHHNKVPTTIQKFQIHNSARSSTRNLRKRNETCRKVL